MYNCINRLPPAKNHSPASPMAIRTPRADGRASPRRAPRLAGRSRKGGHRETGDNRETGDIAHLIVINEREGGDIAHLLVINALCPPFCLLSPFLLVVPLFCFGDLR